MASKVVEEIVEKVGNLSVLELAALVKHVEDTFGVSAAAPVAVAPAAGGAGAGEDAAAEKTEFKVTLKSMGSDKIGAIKALRSVTSLTLKEAKEMVESAPCAIAESASKDDAQKMKEALEGAGATVELS